MEELVTCEGTVHSIIFQNAENGYTVLRLLTEEGEVITVVGCIPCVAPGEHLAVSGVPEAHPQPGEQLRAVELERSLPEDEEEISVTSAAALSNKLLQLANGAVYDEDHSVHEVHNCKIEAFMELIESLQGKPALVFYNFQHDRTRILKALEKTGLRIRELKTTQDEDDWNARKIDILLTHPASSAYGLNLNHVIWFGLTWNYELYTQANKRLHRQGQEEKVIIHHLICSGTRDGDVMEALKRKDDVQSWVMESLKARIRRYRN